MALLSGTQEANLRITSHLVLPMQKGSVKLPSRLPESWYQILGGANGVMVIWKSSP